MASTAASLADQIVSWLNDPARPWAPAPWTAQRVWVPDLDLTDLQASTVPLVEVAPDAATPEEQETRGDEDLTWDVYIGIRQKYAATGAVPNSWVDPLAELAEDIADDLRNTDFTAGFRCRCEDTELVILIDPEALRERREAVSVVKATMREWRQG